MENIKQNEIASMLLIKVEFDKEVNMIKYQCYWNKIIYIQDDNGNRSRGYIGEKVLDKVFDNENDAEHYCRFHVAFEGDEEREIQYEEIEV